jgi:thiosulfate reductase cytochrome b subunit
VIGTLPARAALAALLLSSAATAAAQQAVNPIHPLVTPLDAAGRKTRATEAVDVDRTCGACHDAAWIGAHSGHATAKVKATCVQCHLDGGRLELSADRLDAEGRLARQHTRIGPPRAQSCAACHGVIGAPAAAGATLALPADLEAPPEGHRTWSLTLGEGAIVSPRRMSESFLNLDGKAALSGPWDVHAAKLVDCVACHFAANDPVRTDAKQGSLRSLTADPRRPTTAEYLVRPDHRLAKQACRACHDPQKAHDFLPYRSRHMAVLSCQACHLAGPRGPAAETVDATVATPTGGPAIRWRNLARRPGEPLNAAALTPFRPLLVERVEADGARRLTPVNTVSRFRWVSGPGRQEVPFATVAQVFLEGGEYAPAIQEAFDADRNGRLDEGELRLDSRLKTELVAARLAAAGVAAPAIEGTLDVVPLAHGVGGRADALRDCGACHGASSRLAADWTIAGHLPGGTLPVPPEGARVTLAGLVTPAPGGGLRLAQDPGAAGRLHVLGHAREGLTNTLGFALFLAVFLGVSGHGLVRLATRRHRPPLPRAAGGPRAYVFGRYERIWHWTMALSGVVLIATGLEVHGTGLGAWLGLPRAVSLHNAFAVVLMANAGLALFYHLTTRAIRNFIPAPDGFLARVLEHMAYQGRGIFFGGPHPQNAPGHKLNPLQQITYLALLNVLFPLQIGTGLLLWAAGHWPEVAAALGGLSTVAPLHNLGSWAFISFFVLHAYLVTTGRTPTEHLESMITGYQSLDHSEQTP